MKRHSAKVFATIALSLAVWVFFYVNTPDAPLSAKETSLLVGVCLAVVLFTDWLWDRFRKQKQEKKHGS